MGENERKTARQIVVNLLVKVEKGGSYSNLVLDAGLSQSGLDKQDKSFATALFYGVLERRLTIDTVLSCYSNLPLEKLSPEVRSILRMGIYQLVYMDAIPDSAAVNESVKLVESLRQKSAKGFVNAVLRSFIRDGKKINSPDQKSDPAGYLSVQYSCPRWLVETWIKDYGYKAAEQICMHSLGRPPITIRVNTLKTTADKLVECLKEEGVTVTAHPKLADCLLLNHSGDIEVLSSYQSGAFHVQDIASQICCLALGATEGEHILDVCAAPGGKSFTTAIQMQNHGKIQAFDLHPKRVSLIERGAQRLGVTIMESSVADAAEYHSELCGADRVLCDVPCSGFGVIRRKPEIKEKSKQEIERLPLIQYRILSNVSQYVRPGGILLYSTCTLLKQENEQVAERFLKEHDDFLPAPFPASVSNILDCCGNMATLIPGQLDSDGFFLALFQKKDI